MCQLGPYMNQVGSYINQVGRTWIKTDPIWITNCKPILPHADHDFAINSPPLTHSLLNRYQHRYSHANATVTCTHHNHRPIPLTQWIALQKLTSQQEKSHHLGLMVQQTSQYRCLTACPPTPSTFHQFWYSPFPETLLSFYECARWVTSSSKSRGFSRQFPFDEINCLTAGSWDSFWLRWKKRKNWNK